MCRAKIDVLNSGVRPTVRESHECSLSGTCKRVTEESNDKLAHSSPGEFPKVMIKVMRERCAQIAYPARR